MELPMNYGGGVEKRFCRNIEGERKGLQFIFFYLYFNLNYMCLEKSFSLHFIRNSALKKLLEIKLKSGESEGFFLNKINHIYSFK
jgi:hypothetical protein